LAEGVEHHCYYTKSLLMIAFNDLRRNLKKDVSALPIVKVALLSDVATQFLTVALKGMANERRYALDLFEAEFNQVERQVLDSTSALHQFDAAYNIIFQSSHKLLEQYSEYHPSSQLNLADDRLAFVHLICESVKGRIIYYNYPEIEDTVFGSYATKVASSFTYQLRKLNFELMKLSQEFPNFFICDIAGLQNKFGRDMAFHSNIYTSTEMVLSLDILPYIASRTIDVIAALEGKINKCLILDLDNTLWGGIVGDDGWENLQIGHGLGIGKAFTELQQWIKKLKNRGIILAVCSKNDEEKAKSPFENNPEMVLKLKDIAVFVANWSTKVENILQIQTTLNIGLDTMVFLDDNPFERNIVREYLPEVTVPELPEDPSEYLEYLYSLNLFETASYSSADDERTAQYQVESQRVSLQKTFASEDDFLRSLEMVSEVKGFDASNLLRSSQLSQRSNQFNLRTIRYTEAELAALEKNEDYINFSFTLADKFGDNGLICLVILQKLGNETLFIDTWLMSCRVLKRGMEDFTLDTILSYARSKGFKQLIGEYLPTAKNKMVEEHYPRLGFRKIEDTAAQQYQLEINSSNNSKAYFINQKS